MVTVELKKLARPILLLVALLITFVFYKQELSFLHDFWPNGDLVTVYDYASDWQHRFGQTLGEREIKQVEKEYNTLVQQANEIISENSTAQQLQLQNYTEFEIWHEENDPLVKIDEMNNEEKKIAEQKNSLQQNLVDENGNSMVPKIEVFQDLSSSMQIFDSPKKFFINEDFTEKEQRKLSTILFTENGWRNIMPSFLTSTVSSYFENMLILAILLMSLLFPSIFVRDRLLGLQKLQWSSRRGRKMLWTQFASGMIASFLLITCIVGFFGSLLFFTDFTQYFSNGLNSFFSEYDSETLLVSFYHWTFSQWLVNIIMLVYLIGMAYSGILFFLSQTSPHYLSLLMKIVPIGFIFIFIANRVLKDAFYLKNEVYQWTKIPMVECYAGILLFIGGISLPIILCIRQQRKDLLN